MEEITLSRSKKRPLSFIGELIYKGSSRGPHSSRWDDVRLYRLEGGGGYVIGFVWRTQHEITERDYYRAKMCPTVEMLLAYVQKRLPYFENGVIQALAETKEANATGIKAEN